MKSEERHELKKNELADWLVHFPQWARQNYKTLIYIAVVLILVIGAYIYKNYQENVVEKGMREQLTATVTRIDQLKLQVLQAKSQGQDESYLLLNPANELETFAENAEDSNLKAMALIKRAELLKSELALRGETPSADEFTKQMQMAKMAYQSAIDADPSNTTLMANAKVGLALTSEELGNFDEAKQIYQETVENTELAGTVGVTVAERRLQYIQEFQERIELESSPERAKEIEEMRKEFQQRQQQMQQPMPQMPQEITGANQPENQQAAEANQPAGDQPPAIEDVNQQ